MAPAGRGTTTTRGASVCGLPLRLLHYLSSLSLTYMYANTCTRRKRLIVGGWMMAKEAGACLAEIVRQAAAATAPRAAGAGAKKGQRWSGGGRGEQEVGQQQPQQNEPAVSLLDSVGGVGRVDAVGRTLLRSLGRMKHMGGIQCTQVILAGTFVNRDRHKHPLQASINQNTQTTHDRQPSWP